jgi:hypothetical protein
MRRQSPSMDRINSQPTLIAAALAHCTLVGGSIVKPVSRERNLSNSRCQIAVLSDLCGFRIRKHSATVA